MNEPPNPLRGEVWRRGGALGLCWLTIFCAAGVGSYVLLGILGWSGTGRALCAMGLGPLIGTVAIAAWWLARRPSLWPGPTDDETQAGGS